jgi:hypothetical protein
MPAELRRRFWLESAGGCISGGAAVATLSWHNWIEVIFHADPDKGNGLAEWLVVVMLVMLTLLLGAGARREWRRAVLAS